MAEALHGFLRRGPPLSDCAFALRLTWIDLRSVRPSATSRCRGRTAHDPATGYGPAQAAADDTADGPSSSHHAADGSLTMSSDQLEALLLVQEHDTARDRLRHRRAALPERAELESLLTSANEVVHALEDALERARAHESAIRAKLV